MPKFTFQHIILFSFVYLRSTLFQIAFQHVSNLTWASTLQNKGWQARRCLLAEPLGDPSSEVTHLSCLALHLTSHTSAECTQAPPCGSMCWWVESVMKHPSWSFLRTLTSELSRAAHEEVQTHRSALCSSCRGSALSQLWFIKFQTGRSV